MVNNEKDFDTRHNNESETISENSNASFSKKSEESDISNISEGIIIEPSDNNTYDGNETYTSHQNPDTTSTSIGANDIGKKFSSDISENVTTTTVVTEIKSVDISSVTETTYNSDSLTDLSKKESEPEDTSSIKTERIVNTKYDGCQVVLVSDDIYYIGYNYNSVTPYIFTLNSKDEIVNSAKLADDAGSINVKQLDDKIYVMYNTYSGYDTTGLYCKIFDKTLNLLGDYNLTAFSKDWIGQTTVNENNIFYVMKMKIYSIGYDGKDKKVIFDISNENCDANYINTIAANNDYIAFLLQDSNNEYYYGIVNLKTEETQIIKNNDVDSPQVYGDSIMWTGKASFDNSNEIKSSKKIIVFNNGQFRTVNTKTDYEVLKGACSLTNDGEVVTMEYSKAKYGLGAFYIRMYDKDGKCIKEFPANDFSASGILAGNQTIAYNFDYEDKTSHGIHVASTKLIEY